MISHFKFLNFFLIVFSFFLLVACNNTNTSSHDKLYNKQYKRENIAESKEIAKFLVATSENVLSVVNYCEVLENSDVENKFVSPISELKSSQLKILKSIESTSSEVMVTIPVKTTKAETEYVLDSLHKADLIKKIKSSMVLQKENLSKLKSNTSDQKLLIWADSLAHTTQRNLAIVNKIESSI